jgi:hypothetical protein
MLEAFDYRIVSLINTHPSIRTKKKKKSCLKHFCLTHSLHNLFFLPLDHAFLSYLISSDRVIQWSRPRLDSWLQLLWLLCLRVCEASFFSSHHPRFYYPPLDSPLPLMSHHPTSTSSNVKLIFDNALKAYRKRTKNDLLTHPLADRLKACDSPSSILTVLQEQVQELNGSQRNNTKWLDPTVNVLHAFSSTLGEGVGSVRFRT